MRGVLHERYEAEKRATPHERDDRAENALHPAAPGSVAHGRGAIAALEFKSPPARGRAVSRRRREGESPETHAMVEHAWREYKSTGDRGARDLLIIHYMSGHVRRIAHRLSAQLPRQIDPRDLVQHAYGGLVRLIDRFDPQRDVQFETFSSRRLAGAMKDHLRDEDTSGRLARQRAKRLAEVESRFWAAHGRKPDAAELRDLLGLQDDEAFRRFIDDARAPLTVSFASSSPRGPGATGAAFEDVDGFGGFQDRRLAAPLLRLEREDLKRWLTGGLARRDRLIVVLYYYEQMTMKEIGQTLGCSESRVSQRLDSIIQCLRARVRRLGAGELV